MELQELISKTRWSLRATFPESCPLSDRVFAFGGGMYLITNPDHGAGDPARAVGWAQSDYWAQRAWESPPFRGDLTPPSPQWLSPPSLEFLGHPGGLAFAQVRSLESAQSAARAPIMIRAKYRLTDGAFLYCGIHGANGVTYIYGSPGPKPQDEPVAIEFRLPEKP